MIISINPDNTSILIQFDEEEQQIIAWMHANYSNMEFQNYIEMFMKQRRAQMRETVKQEVWKHLKDDPAIHERVNDSLGIDMAKVFGNKEQ